MGFELIKVKVLYFGEAAEITAKREEQIELAANTTVRSAFEDILSQYPALQTRFSGSLLFALNLEYVPGDEIVKNGDELAIFPPVSGG